MQVYGGIENKENEYSFQSYFIRRDGERPLSALDEKIDSVKYAAYQWKINHWNQEIMCNAQHLQKLALHLTRDCLPVRYLH